MRLPNSPLKTDIKVLQNGLPMFRRYIRSIISADLTDDSFRKINRYMDLYFAFYISLFYAKAVTYPYILEIGETISHSLESFRRVEGHEDEYKKIVSTYALVLSQCKGMVVFSLHHCTKIDINSHIKDFLNLGQVLNYCWNEQTAYLLKIYEAQIIDIVTHIINMVQMHRLDSDMLDFALRALDNIDTIQIGAADTELYYEIFPRVGGYYNEIAYSRNYYIVLLLILCRLQGEDLYAQAFDKLRYGKNSVEDKETLYGLLLDRLEKVKLKDLKLLTGKENLEPPFAFVRGDITARKEKVKAQKQEHYLTADIKKELEVAVKSVTTKLRGITLLNWNENIQPTGYFSLAYSFNIQALSEKNQQIHDYGFTEEYIQEILCMQYVQTENIKLISSPAEIPGITADDVLLVSRTCFDSLHNDKQLDFDGNTVLINGERVAVSMIFTKKPYIALLSDLRKQYTAVRIESNIANAQREVDEKNSAVYVNVFFRLYVVSKNVSQTVYRLL